MIVVWSTQRVNTTKTRKTAPTRHGKAINVVFHPAVVSVVGVLAITASGFGTYSATR